MFAKKASIKGERLTDTTFTKNNKRWGRYTSCGY